MKRIIATFVVFIGLTMVLSSLSGCSGGTGAANTPANSGNNNTTAVNSAGTNSENPADKKPSEYPALAASLANADMESMDGTITRIADRKGKVLLLNMWGTWCGPCRQEMPDLIALQQKYGEQGFEVIGMNIGDGEGTPEPIDKIKTFAEKTGLNYPLVRIPNSMTVQFYKISSKQVVPQSFLLNRDGELRAVFTGGGAVQVEKIKETVAKVMAGG